MAKTVKIPTHSKFKFLANFIIIIALKRVKKNETNRLLSKLIPKKCKGNP